ncbi:MAG: DUF721 domain-containing protein [Bacteroidetes bacterium]|nr:MAG: DUF721 domain-containing protein [Bacteroidota bacterium]
MKHYYHDSLAKRQSEAVSLKEAIGQLLESYQLRRKFQETNLISSWEKIIGKAIARRTTKIFIKKRVFYLELDSAPLKHELVMAKSRLLEMLNEELKEKIVDDIFFL